MTYRGRIKDGAVVLDDVVKLPEGAAVEVEIIPESEEQEDLSEMLMSFAGIIKGMPSDLARNHDHYLHGHPRK